MLKTLHISLNMRKEKIGNHIKDIIIIFKNNKAL